MGSRRCKKGQVTIFGGCSHQRSVWPKGDLTPFGHSSLRCTIGATRLAALFCGGIKPKHVAIMQVMPTPIRTIVQIVAFLALGFYWLLFLSQPLFEGSAEPNRGLFVMSMMLYPEGYFVNSWTDNGRLPLAFLDRLPILAATSIWLALAILIGWPWCKRLGDIGSHVGKGSTLIVQLSLSCLVGLALLSTLTLVVGLVGGLHNRWPLLIGIAILIAGSHGLGILLRRFGVDPTNSVDTDQTNAEDQAVEGSSPKSIFQRVICNAVIFATVWLGIVTMLGAWVPPREFDVVEYHLQAPKEFFQAGRIGFVPHNIYVNMPLGAEMHSLAAMTLLQDVDTWWGGLIGKSITAAISILGAMLLGGWIAQRLGSFSGWSAAGIWLGTPGITHVAMLGLIDGVLATYVLATALTAENLGKASSFSTSARQLRDLFPFCLLGGAAAAIKYPGLIYATLPCLCLLGIAIARLLTRRQSGLAMQMIILAVVAASLTCVPWYAKNWWLAGNPVYPLAANIFGGQTLSPEKIAQWQAAHRVPTAALADAGLPQQVIGQAQRFLQDITRVTLKSSFVQPAWIFGTVSAIAWLVLRRRGATWTPSPPRRSNLVSTSDTAYWILLVWSMWIMAVWWLATHRIDRFWLPVTGLWSALAAWGLWHMRKSIPAVAQTMLVSGLLYGVLVCSSPIDTDNRYFVSLAALRDDVGDHDHFPRVPLIQTWINQNLTEPETRVLLVGEARVFEYRVDVVYSTCFDTNPGEAWLAGTDAEKQRAALAAAGITHVLINWSEIDRYRSPGNYGFSDWPKPSHIEQLVRDQVLLPIEWGEGSDRAQLFRVK